MEIAVCVLAYGVKAPYWWTIDACLYSDLWQKEYKPKRKFLHFLWLDSYYCKQIFLPCLWTYEGSHYNLIFAPVNSEVLFQNLSLVIFRNFIVFGLYLVPAHSNPINSLPSLSFNLNKSYSGQVHFMASFNGTVTLQSLAKTTQSQLCQPFPTTAS